MGFTIEDMLVVSEKSYQMKLIAGKNGWSNSISWVLAVEDFNILKYFNGKELAVTAALSFSAEEKLLELVTFLIKHHSSGLVINTGGYLMEVPQSVMDKCEENDFPLLTVPWDVRLSDMIKDLSIRIFMQERADAQISRALIQALENPKNLEEAQNALLPYFDIEGSFQVIMMTTPNLAEMDTVLRRRLSYSLQLALKNITHNGNFFYYHGCFVLVINDVEEKETEEIVAGFIRRVHRRMPELALSLGKGSRVFSLAQLSVGFKRARGALRFAVQMGKEYIRFEEMGIYQLLYAVEDPMLLKEYAEKSLGPLICYDRENGSEYEELLALYLKENGSIQAVAEKSFTHRNTVLYRLGNIRKILDNPLKTREECLPLEIACLIRQMDKGETRE